MTSFFGELKIYFSHEENELVYAVIVGGEVIPITFIRTEYVPSDPREKPGHIFKDGVNYLLRYYGGNGWSAGLGSIVEAVDGPDAGKLYEVNFDSSGMKILTIVTKKYLEQRPKHYREG